MKVKHSFGIIGLIGSSECVTPIAFGGTSTIHSICMKYPIDVLFLDNTGVVLDKCENLEPWSGYKSRAVGIDRVVEHMSDKFKNFKIGDKIALEYI